MVLWAACWGREADAVSVVFRDFMVRYPCCGCVLIDPFGGLVIFDYLLDLLGHLQLPSSKALLFVDVVGPLV